MSNTEDGFLYTYKKDNNHYIYNGRLVKIIRGRPIHLLEDVKTGKRFYASHDTLIKPLTKQDKLRLL